MPNQVVEVVGHDPAVPQGKPSKGVKDGGSEADDP
jgi:hypothetical protein